MKKRDIDLICRKRSRRIKVLSIVLAFFTIGITIPVEPAEAQIFRGIINMTQNVSQYNSRTYSQVIHRTFSYYANADETAYVTIGTIEKRGFNPYQGGLIYAYTRINSFNVAVPYESNLVQDVNLRLYYYAPRDGTSNYWNSVGWMNNPYAYVSVQYDLPNPYTNHVLRTGGIQVINAVHGSTPTISWGDATSWKNVVTANAAKYNLNVMSPHVEIYIYTYTWGKTWSWTWHNNYYQDTTRFWCQY